MTTGFFFYQLWPQNYFNSSHPNSTPSPFAWS